ncbi:MAG: Lrp/AsnC family transcriptional regulator [Clostridia bacterium]|nr:Lrp/AsnC family transcriptional regulator [Clostridia bacterium]
MRKEILELLETDSKLTPYQIATMLGMDKSKVEKEIETMEEEGIILQYSTLINWEKVGNEQVSALIDVKVIPQRGVGFDDIAERIYRFPEVRSVMLMSGSYDLSVEVTGRNIKEVAQFVAQKLATLEHVQSTVTHFVLKRYKQHGVILDKKEKDRRQVISP